MKRRLLRSLCFLLFCFVCPEAFATLFDVIPTDRSKYYLGIIFGGSIGNVSLGGAFNPTLSLMFERFNFIMVTIATTVLSYIGVLTVINTAREGEALGKKITLWVPLRAFSGVLLMVPGPTSGYSLVQMTVVWVVLNGIGAANQIWNVVLGQLSQNIVAVGTTLSLTSTNQNLINLSHSVLNASTCMYALNNMSSELSNVPGPFQKYQPIKTYVVTKDPTIIGNKVSIQQRAILYVGLEGANDPYDKVCGQFTISTQIDKGNPSNSFNFASLNQRLAIKVAALQAMFSAVDSASQLLATSGNVPSEGYTYAAATGYVSQIVQLVSGIKEPKGSGSNDWETESSGNPFKGNYQKIQSYGWIHAGSYYFSMVKASNALIDPDAGTNPNLPTGYNVPEKTALNANGVPQTAGGEWSTVLATNTQTGILKLLDASRGQTAKLNDALDRATSYWTNDSEHSKLDTEGIAGVSRSSGSGLVDKILNGAIAPARDAIVRHLIFITSGNGDPLMSIGSFGTALMLAGEAIIIFSMVTTLIASLISSALGCVSPLPYAFNMFFLWVAPLIYGLSLALWGIGATMGLYIPLIPYIVFTTGAFGWFVTVVEAVVAAPIMALGLAHPSGEELGKASTGILILANIFLRPTLMIFGFVLAASLLRAGIALVNFGFIAALKEGTIPTLFSILGVISIYASLILMIANKAFSLINLLPNQLFRWMGAPAEAGGGSEEMGKEALGKAEKGSGEKGGEAVGAGMKKAQDVTSDYVEKADAAIQAKNAAKAKGEGEKPKTDLPSPSPGAAGGPKSDGGRPGK